MESGGNVLTVISIIATASLIVTEIILVLTMRAAVDELRAMRRETPRMMGATVGVSLLMAAAVFVKSQYAGKP